MKKVSKLIILSLLVTISTGYLPNAIINTISNTTKAQAQESGKRKALVIGNKDYINGDELKNTINDANAVSKKLKDLGFQVTTLYNLETKEEMRKKLVNFVKNINQGEDVFFYYSGHGVQVDGKNYLIPTKSNIDLKTDISYESLETDYIINSLKENSRFLFVVLDACRDNPFKNKGLGKTKGLVAVRGEEIKNRNQLVVLYATQEDEKASDEHPTKKGLGLFAGELVEVLGKEKRIYSSDLAELTKRVETLSNGKQVPYKYDPQVTEDFYFIKNDDTSNPIQGSRLTTYSNEKEETDEIVVTNVYGNMQVSTKTGGVLYIDGKRIIEIDDGGIVNLSKIKAGYRKLKMEYEDKKEEKNVYVESDSKVKVSFEYEKYSGQNSQIELDKIKNIKANMHAVQLILETYAVDWWGFYPDKMSDLQKEAKSKMYWKDIINPFTLKSGLGKDGAFMDYKKYKDYKPHPSLKGLVLYEAVNPQYDNTEKKFLCITYKIYATDENGELLTDKGGLFFLTNN